MKGVLLTAYGIGNRYASSREDLLLEKRKCKAVFGIKSHSLGWTTKDDKSVVWLALYRPSFFVSKIRLTPQLFFIGFCKCVF